MEPTGAVARLIAAFGKLPGIGPKTAERLTHHLLNAPEGDVLNLADAVRAIKASVHHCRQCFNVAESELCTVCADARRDTSQICVVEMPKDVAALEKAGVYRGLYHVLRGRLAPLEGIGPEKLTVDALLRRVQEGGVTEVIMATNPTLEGDGTALYVSNLLASFNLRITRLARGLPSGSVLEFANKEMLTDALEGRRAF